MEEQTVIKVTKVDNPTIRSFYKNAEIFVTGGTGFLGKALIEKLLMSCDDVKRIYVLLREKRGKPISERWQEFLKNPIFERIHQKNPALFHKLVCITGDIGMPKLGMNDVDYTNLTNKVNVVFHAAATIRFNEKLKLAAQQNTIATMELLNFCAKLKNLKSVVHVSTAFSNPAKEKIEEIVYETEPIDKDSFLTCMRQLSDEAIDCIGDKLQGTHPNTYTLTKSMAESVVADYSPTMPICIVRPSIVTSAIAEPFPGWVDNTNGATGIMIELSRGMLHSLIADNLAHMDAIPVDIVVNTMITAAWANSMAKSTQVKVYNCTSGQINGITWKEFARLIQKYARLNPTKYVMLYPYFTIRLNQKVHRFYETLYHFLPARLFDALAKFQGSEPIMTKLATKNATMIKAVEYFMSKPFVFDNQNMRALCDAVKDTTDGAEFNCDVGSVKWEQYIEAYMLGIRKFVLKDEMESMRAARSKVQILFWIRTIFRMGLSWMLLYFGYRFILRTVT